MSLAASPNTVPSHCRTETSPGVPYPRFSAHPLMVWWPLMIELYLHLPHLWVRVRLWAHTVLGEFLCQSTGCAVWPRSLPSDSSALRSCHPQSLGAWLRAWNRLWRHKLDFSKSRSDNQDVRKPSPKNWVKVDGEDRIGDSDRIRKQESWRHEQTLLVGQFSQSRV